MNEDNAVERMIQERGLSAPRLTPDHIAAVIVGETYATLPSGKVMVCELTLRNGYTVRGEAATVSKANFNEDIGRKVSRENAVREIWQLEGYLLQQRLFDEATRRPQLLDHEALSAVKATRIPIERPDVFARIATALGFGPK